MSTSLTPFRLAQPSRRFSPSAVLPTLRISRFSSSPLPPAYTVPTSAVPSSVQLAPSTLPSRRDSTARRLPMVRSTPSVTTNRSTPAFQSGTTSHPSPVALPMSANTSVSLSNRACQGSTAPRCRFSDSTSPGIFRFASSGSVRLAAA